MLPAMAFYRSVPVGPPLEHVTHDVSAYFFDGSVAFASVDGVVFDVVFGIIIDVCIDVIVQ